jgi:hypothetical protein
MAATALASPAANASENAALRASIIASLEVALGGLQEAVATNNASAPAKSVFIVDLPLAMRVVTQMWAMRRVNALQHAIAIRAVISATA